MKKNLNNITNLSKEFLISRDGEILRLSKGMLCSEVEIILGKPTRTEPCANPLSKKNIYKIKKNLISVCTYMLLFNNEELQLAIKLTK
ncbi:MAG: hypothetical protein Q8M29_14665 [Bacteroidota bacterium]|nr:hypothetical protein [Bacteroidota bacterium]